MAPNTSASSGPSSINEPAERVNTGTSTSTTSASLPTSAVKPSHGLSLGERTRTQSISYPVGDSARKGSVVDADCPLCKNDRIHGVRDVRDAVKLTWIKNKKHLMTTWLHVPVGVVLMLVVVWAIKLGIDRTALRFPSAVLSMIVFLVLLLTLDWLSVKFPGRDARSEDPESTEVPTTQRQRKRFLDPFMAALAPPADFLLRNMSVMFTPSFIMIPAREVIPGREIGILAAYFALTQVLGYVIPVLLCMFVDWVFGLGPRRRKAKEAEKQFEHLRKNSVAGSVSGFAHPFEKSLADAGRVKDAPIVAGLLSTSLVAFAPLRPVQPVIPPTVPEDELVHLRHVAIEQARQQGMGPAVLPPSRGNTLLDTPKSDVSTFQHPARRHAHMKRAQSEGVHILSAGRSTSAGPTARIASGGKMARAVSGDGQVALPFGLPHYHVEEIDSEVDAQTQFRSYRGPMPTQSPIVPEAYEFPPRSPQNVADARRSAILEEGNYTHFSAPEVPQIQAIVPTPPPPARIAFDPVLETAASVRAADDAPELSRQISLGQSQPQTQQQQSSRRGSLFSPSMPGTRRNSLTIIASRTSSRLNSKVNSQIDLKAAAAAAAAAGRDGDNNDKDGEKTPVPSIRCRHNSVAESTLSCGPNAVERLADWLGDLISPTLYLLLVIIGLPLYFVLDFSLPLFLGINLLIFIGSITVVPPKVRRFAHPILTTSVLTVLVIWAFAAMKGRGLKETLLRSYQVNAKYYDIWHIGGYQGPVPGAGDFLISTLDAGIVALAVPCYRYRAELRESFFRLILVLVPCAALSLFAWPGFAHLITLDRSRSLAFAARFMSTPLAIELNNTLGGDENIVVILVVITGIVAAILKEPFFKMMRVSMDDHFIVGATFGATSGAIGASSLIARPKVMAVASLSFVIFGALLLICAAVPPIVDVVRQVAGF
ncbi:hypothetical protein OC835_003533 [Tilletia horrida]|nr:hypothetical protein OC835_003533 [Tilletia horrida]